VAGRTLGDTGREVNRPIDEYRRRLIVRRVAWLGLLGLLGVTVVSGLLALLTGIGFLDAVLLVLPPVIIAVPVAVMVRMLRDHTLTPPERSRLQSYIPIFAAATLFWLIYDQAGNLLTLFADEKVHRTVFGYAFPASWFQSVNPLLILILAPLFALMWTRLGDRAPSTPVKFGLALLGIGASFVLMGFAGAAASSGPVSPLWLVAVYLVQTVAELFLSPVGLSVTTQLAPKRFASQMMGLWFLAVATGDAIGGYVVRLNGLVGDAVYYGLLGLIGIGVGVAVLLASPRIRGLMTGVT
jgi:POT family proton-dependent oligopeptide transporter